MNQKALVAILVILVVGLGVAFAMTRSAQPVVAPTQDSAVTSSVTRPESGTSTAASGAYQWNFTAAGEDVATGAPRTQVALFANGRSYDLGTFQGSCSVMDTDLLPNEKTAAVCWFAGGGDELGVFEEGGKVVVKRGILDEGTPEDGGFRGDFTTVLTL